MARGDRRRHVWAGVAVSKSDFATYVFALKVGGKRLKLNGAVELHLNFMMRRRAAYRPRLALPGIAKRITRSARLFITSRRP